MGSAATDVREVAGRAAVAPASAARLPAWTIAAALVLTALAQYGWTAGFGFINDDFCWVAAAHEASHQPLSNWIGTPPTLPYFRPLVQLSFVLDHALYGVAPFGYHLTNLALEALNVLLVWRLAALVIGSSTAGAVAALLFATHAAHADSVTWVCGRTELLAAALLLAAVGLHWRQRSGWAAVAFAVGLAAKESAVSFPLLALAADWVRARRRWSTLAVYGVVLIGYAVVHRQFTRLLPSYVPLPFLLSSGAFGAAAEHVGANLLKAAAGALSPLPIDGPTAAVMLAAVLTALVWSAHGTAASRPVRFGILWMLVTLIPFLLWFTFVPRYTYIPIVGLIIALVAGTRPLLCRGTVRWTVALVALACVIGGIVGAQRQNEALRRNAALSRRVVDALVTAAPHPVPDTTFVLAGLGPMRVGNDPWARSSVLVYCSEQAVQLAYDDPTLRVAFDQAPPDAKHTQHWRWVRPTLSFVHE